MKEGVMKNKLLMVVVIVNLLVIFIMYIGYCFKIIEKENGLYFSKKQNVIDIFNSNKETFEDLVINAKSYNDNIIIQYNSIENYEQLYSIYGKDKLSESIINAIENCMMTNFIKSDEFFMIYQYAPIVQSDIQIGVVYNYLLDQWDFYYQHDYKNCRHSHKIVYHIYDLLYNNSNTIS